MTPKGRQGLAAVIAEMRKWAGPESEWDQDDDTPQQVLAWADRLALLLVEAPQEKVCQHGHKLFTIGCVSCALLHHRHDTASHPEKCSCIQCGDRRGHTFTA